MTEIRNALLKVCGVVAMGLLASPCRTPPVASPAPAVGEYTLVSINGTPVPGIVANNQGVRLEVLSGSFVIRPEGTCTSRTVFVDPSGTEVVREVDATCARDDGTLIMRWEGAGITRGTVEDDTFTMDNAGMVMVYRRVPTGPSAPARRWEEAGTSVSRPGAA